jgi:cobalt/nickel transport system permease protein
VHVPDGILTGEAALVGAAIAVAGVGVCLRRSAREMRERDLPIAGLAAAFFLVGEAPLFPVAAGTQAHLLGGLLAVALLGPWLGALTLTCVVAVQALAFGNGGITTLGVTVCFMALIPVVVGHPLLVVLRRLAPSSPRGLAGACGVAAGCTVLASACCFVAWFALGAGIPLDLPAFAATTLGAYAVVAVVEGILTALLVRSLVGVRPDLVRAAAALRVERRARAAAHQAELAR